MEMKKQKKLRGSMTIFAALVMILTLAVVGICTEYGRQQAIEYMVQAGTSAAAESVFAAYHAPLAEEYQLYGRLIPGKDMSSLEEETKEYVGAWGQAESAAGSLTAFVPQSAAWTQMVMLTDENGAVFRELATQAMKASAGNLLTDLVKEEAGKSQDADIRNILEENSRKDTMKSQDLFQNYEDMKNALQEEQKRREEEAKRREEEEALTEQAAGSEEGAQDLPDSGQEERERQQDMKKGKKYLRLLAAVRELLKKGILGVAVPKGKVISKSRIPSGNLPSSMSSSQKGRCVRSVGKGSGSSLLFREYLMRHMHSFRSENISAPPYYELEYLIGGKTTDEANLRSAVVRILWIRTALNMHSLGRFPLKQQILREAAFLAVGWTGNAALVETVVKLLTTAWSFSEGLADIRILLDGGFVPLIKEEADWQLSLENAADGWREADRRSGSREDGMAYEDYLRICLYYQSLSSLSYRAMDVIQWNIRRLDRRFRMDSCMVEGRLGVTASSRLLFSPLYGFLVKGGKKTGFVRKSTGFSYIAERIP